MNGCLSQAQLELLARQRQARWRGWLWRRHLSRCPACRLRLAQAQADESFLDELRRAAVTDPKPPPLPAARNPTIGG
ncbi:MAG: hypothetical protein NZ700_06995 [Gemmataceae bacterium]|nr:hypothetical protein [Gemmataceae bacterium]MDW8265177.1 hypothetical protein [Gemmataceae bacterium]